MSPAPTPRRLPGHVDECMDPQLSGHMGDGMDQSANVRMGEGTMQGKTVSGRVPAASPPGEASKQKDLAG